MSLFKITVSERYEKTFYQEAADKEEAEDMILSDGINMTDDNYVYNSTRVEVTEYTETSDEIFELAEKKLAAFTLQVTKEK